MYDYTLHRGRTHFYRYCLQGFITEEIIKPLIEDCFEINSKQGIKMPKKGEYIKFKNFDRKIESPFMIYGDLFEKISKTCCW